MTENQKPVNRKLITGVVIYAVLFFLVVALANLSTVNSFLMKILDVIGPVLAGLAIAYLVNPLFRAFERKVFAGIRSASLRRGLSLLLTYLVVLAVIAGLLLLIIPQLADSVKTFASNFNSHLDDLVSRLNTVIAWLNEKLPAEEDGSDKIASIDRSAVLKQFNTLWISFTEWAKNNLTSGNLSQIFTVIGQTASAVTDTILAIFISLYILATKEMRYAQVIKFRLGWFSERVNRAITRVCTIADRSFGGFLRGKLLDSTIVGILVYLFCVIIRIQNPLLIAVVVGVTDIVPVIGPFIGVVPTALLILLTDPVKVIFYILAILIIQQVDGNIIAPKILGDNTGVSSLCVMIAIIVMGSLWGLVGMLVGVPLFATVLELLKIWISRRLSEKGLPDEVESYYDRDSLGTTPESAKGIHRTNRLAKFFARSDSDRDGGTGMLSEREKLSLDTLSLAVEHGILGGAADTTDTFDAFLLDEQKMLESKKRQEIPADEPPVESAPVSDNSEEGGTADV